MDIVYDNEIFDHFRYMRLTLQFLLSIDVMLTAVSYFVVKLFGQLEPLDEYFYIAWMVYLGGSAILMAFTTVRTFAKIRFIYGFTHLLATIFISNKYGFIAMPICYTLYYSFELVYIYKGIKEEQMNFPGNWMADFWDSYKEEEEHQMDTTIIPPEIIHKACSMKEFYMDNEFFEFYNAYEDTLFPMKSAFQARKPKPGATFIV